MIEENVMGYYELGCVLMKAIRLKEKKVAEEIVVVSCGPEKCQVS